MRASRNLHNTMFQGVSRARMYFFHTNPSGRILNRFSKVRFECSMFCHNVTQQNTVTLFSLSLSLCSFLLSLQDMGQVDELLPAVMIDVMQIFLQLGGIIVVIVVVNYYFIIPTLVNVGEKRISFQIFPI